MSELPKTQEQYSSHIPALHTLAALGYACISQAFLPDLQSQLWVAVVKYALQKSASFARVRVTTPAAPLLQAYQGGFFYA